MFFPSLSQWLFPIRYEYILNFFLTVSWQFFATFVPLLYTYTGIHTLACTCRLCTVFNIKDLFNNLFKSLHYHNLKINVKTFLT